MHVRPWLLALLASSLLACRGTAGEPKDVVARVGGRILTARSIGARLKRTPARDLELFARDPEAKRHFVEGLTDEELLALEGERRGLHRDPAVLEATRRAIRKRVLELELAEIMRTATVTEAELKAAYDRRVAEFRKPGEARVSAIVRYAKEAADRTAAHRILEATEGDVARAPVEAQAIRFNEAVARLSEDEGTRRGGGDLQFKTERELVRLFGASTAEAIAGAGLGRLFLVDTSTSVVLLRKTGDRRPIVRDLAAVRPQLTAQILREKNGKALEARMAALRRELGVSIDPKAVDALPVPRTSEGGEAEDED